MSRFLKRKLLFTFPKNVMEVLLINVTFVLSLPDLTVELEVNSSHISEAKDILTFFSQRL